MQPASSVSNQSVRWLRWPVLLLTCVGLTGQFYAFDNPSALNEQLQEHCVALQPSLKPAEYAYDFNVLYSVYSFPNVLLPFVLGCCVDLCGVRRLIVVLALFVLAGHATVAHGAQRCNWSIMWTGRAIFGIGGESIQVAQNALLFRWFKGRELAFALGLNLSIARAGSVLNDVISPWVATHQGSVAAAFWLGVVLCALSAFCNIGCVVVDWRAELKGFKNAAVADEETKLADVVKLPTIFWYVSALCVLLYCCILPFNNIAAAFFVETAFNTLPPAEARQQAGNSMSLMFLVSAVGTPIFGAVVDKIGFRTIFLLASSMLLTLSYAALPHMSPAVAMIILGVVYTVFAAVLWPMFALAVKDSQVGTAYGVATALQNVGLAVVPLIIAHMQAISGPGDFSGVLHFFVFLSLLGCMFSLLIRQENYVKMHGLDTACGQPIDEVLLEKKAICKDVERSKSYA